MKKLILLSISVFLGLQLAINSSAKAQNFNIVASFGTTQNWGVPSAIMYEVDYFYPYHRFVHVNRFVRGRHVFFDVLLEQQGNFIALTFGRDGNIINTNYYSNYPLASHICSAYCGYHSNYYYQQQVVCHAHNHGGHNHINYYQEPRYSGYSRPTSVRVVYNNGHNGHHGHNGYRGKNKNYKDNGNGRGRNDFNKPKREDSDRINAKRPTSSPTRSVARVSDTRNTGVASTSNGRNSSSRSSSTNRSSSSNTRSTSNSRVRN